jgi:hypothetical protein
MSFLDRYVYLQWTKRAREDIYTFTYHEQNGQEKIYILLHTMNKTGNRKYIYFYLQLTKRAREDMSILSRFVHGK